MPGSSSSVAAASSLPEQETGVARGIWLKETGAQSGIWANVVEVNHEGNQTRIGVVHRMGKLGIESIKLQCCKHKNCTLWLSLNGQSYDEGMRDLMEWIALAADHRGGISEQDHWARGQALKRAYGMKLT